MSIARFVLKTLMFKARAFENATKDPMKAQKTLLLNYLVRNKDTEYGRKYHFREVRSSDDYRLLVPLSDSETIFPYVERIKRGKNNVLTKDKVVFFGLTSGTTGKPKLIPVTNYSRAKKAQTMELWAYYISRDYPRILNGKVLAIVNPEEEVFTDGGIPCGAESGHAYKNMPAIVKKFYAIPYDAFRIQDFEARYYCMLRIGMGCDITTIASLNPSTIVLLCQKIEKYKDIIIEDIAKGTLYKGVAVPPDIRAALARSLRPDPERAAWLKFILEEKRELLPKYFWPNLQLIECWKGGTMKVYLKELPQYFDDVPLRDFGCLSTEARGSIPMSDAGAGGVLAINTNFYEFIPKEDMGRRDKRFLLADELTKGREYFLIVTTPSGLYRYNIDDIITVNGFYNKTPVVEFVQKGLNAVSLAGEKLYESQIDGAVNRVLERYKLIIGFFSVSIQWEKPARYVFLMEFGANVPTCDKKELLASIEEELRKENAEYKYVRDAQLLKSPILKTVKAGEFERYRARRVSEGANDSQFKVPELTSDADFQKNFIIEEEVRLD